MVWNRHCYAFRFFLPFHPQPEAMAAKYHLSSLHYDGFYNMLARLKMTNFLIDERKGKAKITAENITGLDEA